VLITGISKSGFGGGLDVLAVPLMARWDRPNIKIMLPASLVGVVIGAMTFRYLSDAHIRILVGTIAVAFSISFFLRRNNAERRGPRVARLST
jgi:hypothetical protein